MLFFSFYITNRVFFLSLSLSVLTNFTVLPTNNYYLSLFSSSSSSRFFSLVLENFWLVSSCSLTPNVSFVRSVVRSFVRSFGRLNLKSSLRGSFSTTTKCVCVCVFFISYVQRLLRVSRRCTYE